MYSTTGPPPPVKGKDVRKSKLKTSRQIINTSTVNPPTSSSHHSNPTRDNGYGARSSRPSTPEPPSATEKKRAIAMGKSNRDVLRSVRPLPGGLEVEKFALARSFEISAMQVAMRTAAAGATSRAFQSLPRHLRRRAASHNPRRVPKRLRGKATAEIDSKDKVVQTQKKRLRAKAKLLRKRGTSKTELYRSRQRSKAWLETHIWHAKRMKMVNIWGHRLAQTPTQKSHRPSIRAARNGCIVHDASYVSTIELSGSRDDLVGVLKGVVGGGGWAGSRYEPGGRMAETTFYRHQAWPRGMIGPLEILWRPLAPNGLPLSPAPSTATGKGKRKRTEEDDRIEAGQQMRQVWLRVHPATFEDVYRELEAAIKCYCERVGPEGRVLGGGDGGGRETSQIVMKDLRGDLLSFELVGPRAARILRSVTHLTASNKKGKAECWEALGELQTMAGMPAGLVMGFEVHDPRLQFPPRKGRSPWSDPGKNVVGAQALRTRDGLASSLIWDEERRAGVFKPKYKKSQLDGRRNALGLPGSKLVPTDQDDRIPILVIQRSVQSHDWVSRFPAFHGLTVLVPAGWGMPFWQSLVFSGSLIGGLDERHTLNLEAGRPSFPFEVPFSPEGNINLQKRGDEEEARWLRRPPAKRANYEALGTRHPFIPGWQELCAGGAGSADPWLLDERVLGTNQLDLLSGAADPAALLAKFIAAYRKGAGLAQMQDDVKAAAALGNSFVRVTLRPVEKGSFHDLGLVLAPPAKPDQQPSVLVGYVLAGNYSVSQGRSRALACVSLSGYLRCLADSRRLGRASAHVFVRNRNEEGHREATMIPL